MESIDEKERTLFQIINNKDKTPQIRCYLRRNDENGKCKVYEMFLKDKKEVQKFIEIKVSYEKYYLFSFHFKMGGIMLSSSTIKVNFIKDDNNPNWKRYKPEPKNENEFKTKNLKNENITNLIFGYIYL